MPGPAAPQLNPQAARIRAALGRRSQEYAV